MFPKKICDCFRKHLGRKGNRNLAAAKSELIATSSTGLAPHLSRQSGVSEVLAIAAVSNQPVPESSQLGRPQLERHDGRACNAPEPPKPYASSLDMWNEALGHLKESGKHENIHNIEKLADERDCDPASMPDVKSLAITIQKKLEMVFEPQKHNSRTHHIIENAVAVLNKFASAVDVAINFDPVHAALPWAVVRSVLTISTSASELRSQILAGIAMVASLLAQCDTYQQLYMAPEPALRPPGTALCRLKTFIVQTYTKAQLFLSFAMQQQQQGKIKSAAAPFKLGSAGSHINELSKCGERLHRTAEDCEKHCNLSNRSNRSNVEQFLELEPSFHAIIYDQIKLVLERMDSKEQIEILEWISPLPYGRYHDRVAEARTSDTCEWLLKHDKLRKWEDASSSMILWLQGFPGSGKTFLTSKLIDSIRARLEKSTGQEGFAFFYCDRNEEQRRKPLSVLRSYVRQLSTTPGNPDCIRKPLQDFCRQTRQRGADLGFSDCKEQLLQSLNLYPQTTIVLDALDECEQDLRKEIIGTIEELVSKSENPLKVFISSRPDRDIRHRFLDKPNIEIQATDNEEDIRAFVSQEITKHESWGGMSQDLQNEIVGVLFDKSQGMFQWAFLQINEILDLETESAIRDRLGKLPSSLKSAYDEIYDRIKSRHKKDRDLADRAFKLVACACEPLSSRRLLSAIRFDSDTDTLDLSDTIKESQLLHLCNNLLVIDSQRYVWRFSHLSVIEYFEESHWDLRRAHCHVANICLKLLIEAYKNLDVDEIFDEEPTDTPTDEPDFILGERQLNNLEIGYPFEPYARTYWMDHTRAQQQQEADPMVTHLLKTFLGSPSKSIPPYRTWCIIMARKVQWPYIIFPRTVASWAMCYFALYESLLDWWQNEDFDVSEVIDSEDNLLTLAIYGGSKQICENLVKRGINVNLPFDHYEGSALILAAGLGQTRILDFLVNEAGADVDMQLPAGTYGSAFSEAAARGNAQVAKLLIEAGANVNMQLQRGWCGSALAIAAYLNHTETIELLLQAGADVNMPLESGCFGSALVAAAARPVAYPGTYSLIKLLIESGADVNMPLQNGKYGSALAAAAERKTSHIYKRGCDIDECVRLLVEAGADVNAQLRVGDFGSALGTAIVKGSMSTVDYLISNGADVNQQIQHGECGSALAAAAFFGKKERADIFIKSRCNSQS
ncbi:hypothetical protein NUW58_g1386 [Xylaria curta]|uniref:Uncharacterized protein n=1 Tax=Xylaria curta TaxID=42375 RepID=A0ACC1PNQ4_9PEZI|nr:hypothetical protein NUW58_g1386 [Xylaria curta]